MRALSGWYSIKATKAWLGRMRSTAPLPKSPRSSGRAKLAVWSTGWVRKRSLADVAASAAPRPTRLRTSERDGSSELCEWAAFFGSDDC